MAPNPLDNQMLKAQLVEKMKYMININKTAIAKVQIWKRMVINYKLNYLTDISNSELHPPPPPRSINKSI